MSLHPVDRHLGDPVDPLRIVDHEPAHHLAVRSVGSVTGDIHQLEDLVLFDGLVDVAPNRPPRDQVLPDPVPPGDEVDVDRLAILGAHRALVHGLGRTDRHAMAAVDAQVPPVLDGNGEILFGDETPRAGADAAPTSNAQALIGLDHGVEFVG